MTENHKYQKVGLPRKVGYIPNWLKMNRTIANNNIKKKDDTCHPPNSNQT